LTNLKNENKIISESSSTSPSSAAEEEEKEKEIKENDQHYLDGFELFGIVKETGVDDAGLTDFYKDYYPFPLYRDENLDFYNAFGKDAKVTDHMSWSMLLNPFKLFGGMKQVNKRMSSRNIEGNVVGEGFKTGGIIIFDVQGRPKYCYPEVTGSELNLSDLLAAVESVKNENGITGSTDVVDGDNNNTNKHGADDSTSAEL